MPPEICSHIIELLSERDIRLVEQEPLFGKSFLTQGSNTADMPSQTRMIIRIDLELLTTSSYPRNLIVLFHIMSISEVTRSFAVECNEQCCSHPSLD